MNLIATKQHIISFPNYKDKLKYSPDASDKLKEHKKQILTSYGSDVATKIVSKIMHEIRNLQDNPEKALRLRLF